MKEFHLTMKLRNNLLRSRRLELGLTSIEAAEAVGVSPAHYCAFETMRVSPLNAKGGWRPTALRIAAFYGEPPEELWPAAILGIEQPEASRELSSEDVQLFLSDHSVARQLLPDAFMNAREQHAAIQNAMAVLSPKQKYILERRFGLDGDEPATVTALAEQFNVGLVRIRQITDKALNLLRQRPQRKYLIDESDLLPQHLCDLLHMSKDGLSLEDLCRMVHPTTSAAHILGALRTLRKRLEVNAYWVLQTKNINGVSRWFIQSPWDRANAASKESKEAKP